MIFLLLLFAPIVAAVAAMLAFGAAVLWLLGFVGGAIGAGIAAIVRRRRARRGA